MLNKNDFSFNKIINNGRLLIVYYGFALFLLIYNIFGFLNTGFKQKVNLESNVFVFVFLIILVTFIIKFFISSTIEAFNKLFYMTLKWNFIKSAIILATNYYVYFNFKKQNGLDLRHEMNMDYILTYFIMTSFLTIILLKSYSVIYNKYKEKA